MRDHDDLPYIVIERRSAGLGPFLWGAVIGAAAGLLLAPRAGAETQDDLRDRARRARTAAEDGIETARDTVTRTRERFEGRLDSVKRRIGDVREQIDERAEQARGAVAHGRSTGRDAREEIERRVQDARGSYRADAPEPLGGRPPAGTSDRSGVDVIITDVSEERAEGRSDIG